MISEIIREKAVVTLFQPIVDLRNAEIIGYVALSRGPENSPLRSPLSLIERAEEEGCLWELESLFREKALATAKSLGLKNMLFLNVDPNIVNDSKFISGFTKQYIQTHGLLPEMIVFKITERSAIDNYKSFRSAMLHYHDQGYKTAIDDTGAGYSNLSVISKIKPHFIKIDMELVRDVDRDSFKQAIIKSFVWLANLTNTTLIAEGIETMHEARTLISLGVHAGQGYLLGRPSQELASMHTGVRTEILNFNTSSSLMHSYASKYIGEICETVEAFDAETLCSDIRQYFNHCDAIIKMTKDVICRSFKDKYTFSSFIGHIGGDDFLAVVNCDPQECAELCGAIIADFNSEVLHYFNEEDITRGFISGRARNTKELIPFPLTSMTIAVLHGVMSGFETPDRLSYQLSKIKSSAKAQGGGQYVIERVE